MLTVQKRSGKTEPFYAQKVRASLEATSDEAGQPLNEGDIETIQRELLHMLEEKTTVTSRQIYIMIVGILYAHMFDKVVCCYRDSVNNAWR